MVVGVGTVVLEEAEVVVRVAGKVVAKVVVGAVVMDRLVQVCLLSLAPSPQPPHSVNPAAHYPLDT